MSLLQLELEQQAVDHQQSPMHRSESLPSGIVAEHCGAIQMTRDATGRSEDGILAVEMNRSRTKTDCKISEIYSKDLQMVTFQQYKLVGAFGWLTTPKLNVHYFSRVFFYLLSPEQFVRSLRFFRSKLTFKLKIVPIYKCLRYHCWKGTSFLVDLSSRNIFQPHKYHETQKTTRFWLVHSLINCWSCEGAMHLHRQFAHINRLKTSLK